MKTEIQNIAELHAVIATSSVCPKDGANIDLPAALIALADAVHALDHTDDSTEFIWSSIGEHTECPLGDLIVGAYWALSEWHGGQSSDTYAALCALGQVFSPGMSDGPEEDSCEYGVYEMINQHFDSLHNPLPAPTVTPHTAAVPTHDCLVADVCHPGARITPCHHAHPLHAAWLARVAELEGEGLDTSDAQSVADNEFNPTLKP